MQKKSFSRIYLAFGDMIDSISRLFRCMVEDIEFSKCQSQ